MAESNGTISCPHCGKTVASYCGKCYTLEAAGQCLYDALDSLLRAIPDDTEVNLGVAIDVTRARESWKKKVDA